MEANLKVTLLTHTPMPEQVVGSAAKLCYSQSGVKDLMINSNNEKNQEFIHMLVGLGHESPFEHISFTFAIEGVSRSLTHQLVRHRMANYSQQSQRYVKEGSFEYIVPPEIKDIPEAYKLYKETMEAQQKAYDSIAKILEDKHCKEYLSFGENEVKAKSLAEKKAIEDARFVLPNACETKIVVTMNARSLFNFFHHRCCNRAQWEIRELATEMLKIVKEVAPSVFSNCGPNCIGGACPEGAMTCGQIGQVREKFRKL